MISIIQYCIAMRLDMMICMHAFTVVSLINFSTYTTDMRIIINTFVYLEVLFICSRHNLESIFTIHTLHVYYTVLCQQLPRLTTLFALCAMSLLYQHLFCMELSSCLYLGSRVVWYGFWAYLSRTSKFSFLLSLATQATSPCVAESKAVASLKMVMQGLQTLPFCRTVLTGQINVRVAKGETLKYYT